jgi:hypothetical protein
VDGTLSGDAALVRRRAASAARCAVVPCCGNEFKNLDKWCTDNASRYNSEGEMNTTTYPMCRKDISKLDDRVCVHVDCNAIFVHGGIRHKCSYLKKRIRPYGGSPPPSLRNPAGRAVQGYLLSYIGHIPRQSGTGIKPACSSLLHQSVDCPQVSQATCLPCARCSCITTPLSICNTSLRNPIKCNLLYQLLNQISKKIRPSQK